MKNEGLDTAEEKNKEFILAYTEDFWNRQNIAAYVKYYAAGFINHSAGGDQDFEQANKIIKP